MPLDTLFWHSKSFSPAISERFGPRASQSSIYERGRKSDEECEKKT